MKVKLTNLNPQARIETIKAIRVVTGLGLKEAKAVMDTELAKTAASCTSYSILLNVPDTTNVVDLNRKLTENNVPMPIAVMLPDPVTPPVEPASKQISQTPDSLRKDRTEYFSRKSVTKKALVEFLVNTMATADDLAQQRRYEEASNNQLAQRLKELEGIRAEQQRVHEETLRRRSEEHARHVDHVVEEHLRDRHNLIDRLADLEEMNTNLQNKLNQSIEITIGGRHVRIN